MYGNSFTGLDGMHGVAVTWRRVQGTYDRTSGTVTDASDDTALVGRRRDVSERERSRMGEALSRAVEFAVAFTATQFDGAAPELKDRLVIEGKEYEIHNKRTGMGFPRAGHIVLYVGRAA